MMELRPRGAPGSGCTAHGHSQPINVQGGRTRGLPRWPRSAHLSVLRPCGAAPTAAVNSTVMTSDWAVALAAEPAPVVRQRADARALTRRLQAAQSLADLQHLVAWQHHRFNHIHLAAALSRLVHLSKRGGPDDTTNMHTLASRLSATVCEQHILCTSGTRELSTVLRAVAVLGVALPVGVMRTITDAWLRRLPSANGRDVGMALWALARCGYHPGAEWLSDCAAQLPPKLQSMDGQALANTAWALARLGFKPPLAWLDAFITRCHTQLGGFSGQTHAAVLWALGVLGERGACTPAWAAALDALLLPDPCMHFSPQSLALLLHSLGRQSVAPWPGQLSPAALAAASRAAVQGMGALSTQQAAGMLLGLAHVGQHPGPAGMAAFFTCTSASLRSLDASTLAHVALALQRLSHLAPGSEETAHTSKSSARLAALPPQAWLDAYWAASAAMLPRMGSRLLAMCGYGMSEVGARPPLEWQHAYLSASQAALAEGRASDADLLCMAVTAARWRAAPPALWADSFMRAYATSLTTPGASVPRRSSRTLLALARLQLTPGPHAMQAMREQFAEQAADVAPQDVRALRQAAALLPQLDLSWVDDMAADMEKPPVT